MSRECLYAFSGCQIPETNSFIFTRTCQDTAIGTKIQTRNEACVSHERLCVLSGRQIPEVDFFIPRACQGATIRADGHAKPIENVFSLVCRSVRISLERQGVFTGGDIPDTDSSVVSRTRQSTSIGTEDDAPNSARMSSQRFFLSSGISIPERNGATPRRACQGVPTRTESDALNP